jgi:hypothetical protein
MNSRDRPRCNTPIGVSGSCDVGDFRLGSATSASISASGRRDVSVFWRVPQSCPRTVGRPPCINRFLRARWVSRRAATSRFLHLRLTKIEWRADGAAKTDISPSLSVPRRVAALYPCPGIHPVCRRWNWQSREKEGCAGNGEEAGVRLWFGGLHQEQPVMLLVPSSSSPEGRWFKSNPRNQLFPYLNQTLAEVYWPTEQLRRWAVVRRWYAKPAAAMWQLSRASQANAVMHLASNENIGGRIAPASLRDTAPSPGSGRSTPKLEHVSNEARNR